MLDSLSIEEFTEEEKETLEKLGKILNFPTPGEIPEVSLGDVILPRTLVSFLAKTVFMLNRGDVVYFYNGTKTRAPGA